MRGGHTWRFCGLLVASIFAAEARVQAVSDCESIKTEVDASLDWKPVSRGLEFVQIPINSPRLLDLTLMRYSNQAYRTRTFDMRDISIANQSKGFYSPPLYALSELQRSLSKAAVLASGGLTLSYSDPVPAGFLRVEGSTRGPVAPNDKILDGVVCVTADGRPSILSEVSEGSRRASTNLAKCVSGFQAGPVLLADSVPTATQHRLLKQRVALAVTSRDESIVAYSSSATTAGLGCALSASKIAATSAIGLQGDSLGGLTLGPVFNGVSSRLSYGNTEATIASALVVEARSSPQFRTLDSSRRR